MSGAGHAPTVLVVMAVSGSGKTTIVAAVLRALGPVPPVGPLTLDKGWEPFA